MFIVVMHHVCKIVQIHTYYTRTVSFLYFDVSCLFIDIILNSGHFTGSTFNQYLAEIACVAVTTEWVPQD